MKPIILCMGLISVSLILGGCSSVGVKAWERGHLAEKKMQLEPYPLDSFLDDHIYFSKEGSSGGRGAGGGGCGCN
ncbi:MAG: DUF4266 domain-containing protein [Gammaproteobacteria bacterium]|nr:DUF4266 domain-containing protein [Gammaproteobacteria bacterium]